MESVPIINEFVEVRRRALMRLNPRNPSPTIFDLNPAARYQSLRLGISMILGDFKSAAEVQVKQLLTTRKELVAYRAQHFPKGLPDITNMPTQRELVFDVFYQPSLAALHYVRREYYRKVEELLALSQTFAVQQVRIGMTFLEQGNVPLAAHHFRQSLDTPEWKTPLPAQRTASEFLKAFDRAGLPQGGTP